MSGELWALGACEASDLFRNRQIAPSDVLTAVLGRLSAINPQINAFATLDEAGAEAAAKASGDRWANGAPLSPLDGVVITVKDNITVRGLPCRWGTELFWDFVPEFDEVGVARLRAAGAVILGKTTTSEFSNGRGIVSTPRYGTTRNPWNLEHTTGSSSGGAAASVASGIGPIAIATDGGGSIRTPSSYCGLVGLKPTAGRVPRARGLPIINGEREVLGPIARSVADIAAVMRIISGSHPEDRLTWGLAPLEQRRESRRLRILYVADVGAGSVSHDIGQGCDAVAGRLADLGHDVEQGELPISNLDDLARVPPLTQAGMAWLLRNADWQGKTIDFYADMVTRGQALSAVDYLNSLASVRAVQADIGRCFERWDMILSPTRCEVAGPADTPSPGHLNTFTAFANIAGIPAISIPAGFSAEGLPFGFQLAAPFGADALLLEITEQYEQAHPWRQVWPPLSGN